jgi:hypothetical protein
MRENGNIAPTRMHEASPFRATVWKELREGTGWCALWLLITAGAFVAALKAQDPNPRALLERTFNLTMF